MLCRRSFYFYVRTYISHPPSPPSLRSWFVLFRERRRFALLDIFTSSHLHIFTSCHLHIFTSSRVHKMYAPFLMILRIIVYFYKNFSCYQIFILIPLTIFRYALGPSLFFLLCGRKCKFGIGAMTMTRVTGRKSKKLLRGAKARQHASCEAL